MQKTSIHYKHCLDTLKKSKLFSNVDEITLENMLEICQYETINKGATAVSQYRAVDTFYIIVSGRAKVSAYNQENGREYIVFLLDSGDCFDLAGLLSGKHNDAFATSLENMEVLSTSIAQARTWIEQHPEFNKTLFPYLGKQIHELVDKNTDLALYDTEIRLSRLILRSITANKLTANKLTTDIQLLNDLSQETLAAMVGSVRVVITRHLQRWKKEKIVSGKRGNWSLIDLKKLLDRSKNN
ncbi:MAG: Crp/Fnr family transcriptional regulator [Colwellia sp.]|nr:Crp/Fnr family transcriptional regulator [Colwellia sp.]